MDSSIIFDLDNCLCAADEVGQGFHAPVFAAIRRCNEGALTDAALSEAFADCMRFPFDEVAEKFGFTRAMRDAGLRVLESLEVVTPMHGYGDLHVLRELQARRFLVTSGFVKLQRSKIAMLGVGPWFEAVRIDAVGKQPRRGKRAVFEDLVRHFALRAGQVWVVGDNARSEIAAGNQLGMRTVQILRPGVERSDAARYTVKNLFELKALIGRTGRRESTSPNLRRGNPQ